jgi:hypothetical protein
MFGWYYLTWEFQNTRKHQYKCQRVKEAVLFIIKMKKISLARVPQRVTGAKENCGGGDCTEQK